MFVCDQHNNHIYLKKLRRTESGRKPMSPWERRTLTLLRCFNKNLSEEDDAKSSQIFVPPYDEETGFIQGMYYAMHLRFHDLIVWKTQTSYSIFFAYVFAWYLIWINLFALLLYGAIVGIYDSNSTVCITSFEFEPDHMQTDFHQNMEWAFEQSWTTFATGERYLFIFFINKKNHEPNTYHSRFDT